MTSKRFLKVFANPGLLNESYSLSSGQVASYSTPRPGRVDNNQDSAFVGELGEGHVVLGVADGMGGHPLGDFASRVAVEGLKKISSNNGSWAIHPIITAFEKINQKILARKCGAGTTLVVAEVRGGYFRTYHVGDSIILVVGRGGKIRHVTIPDSISGRIGESFGDDSEILHGSDFDDYVLNYLGSREMRVHVSIPFKLNQSDTILLGSDGVFDNLTREEIISLVRSGKLESASRSLSERILQVFENGSNFVNPKPDDVTFLMYRLTNNKKAVPKKEVAKKAAPIKAVQQGVEP